MIEVEQKFREIDVAMVIDCLTGIGAIRVGPIQHHADTYFNHPCRDFAETKEAFRVRRVDGLPSMTYKGRKLPGNIKARREIELSIGSTEQDGAEFEDALQLLGFRRVATVTKRRQTFHSPTSSPDPSITIALDHVDGLGDFVELEIIAAGETDVDSARNAIARTAEKLGLEHPESRSYLTMWLEKR